MTRKADLIALRDAVQAGEPNRSDGTLYRLFADDWVHAWDVIDRGSVDAALAFLAAVLPEWHFDVATSADGLAYYAHVSSPGEFRKVFMATSETPARALLLATLNALIGEME